MDELKNAIVCSTKAMVSQCDWRSIIIDMEVEQRGKEPRKYFVDSSVAVCICRVEEGWTDQDLELSKEYRELFHRLYTSSDHKWGSCRLIIERDGSVEWHFEMSPASRLNGKTDTDIDDTIEKLLSGAKL